ncbi:hypothetical protein PFZ55_41150 [Streptomyces sp. MS2A]|nr:hypothetical protein [Streptomyces sp. MS2A]
MSDLHHGRGYKAYRRKRAALRRRVEREGLPCGYGGNFGCGEPFDLTLQFPDPMSFSADHPDALINGGHLLKQTLIPMHLGCNSRKNDAAEVEIWEAS